MAALDARIRVELDRQRRAAVKQLDVLRDVHDGDLGDLTEYAARWWLTVAAVLDLHKQDVDEDGEAVCWKCRGRGDDWPDEWPCETVRALAQNLGIEDA